MTRKAYSTTTRTSDDRLVPWLAAEGPLAYTPESPPVRDSFFQYGWVVPQVAPHSVGCTNQVLWSAEKSQLVLSREALSDRWVA